MNQKTRSDAPSGEVLDVLRDLRQLDMSGDLHRLFVLVRGLKERAEAACDKLDRSRPNAFEDAIGRIRSILWRTPEGWDPDKEWDSETIDDVARVLDDLGLRPRKKSSQRKSN